MCTVSLVYHNQNFILTSNRDEKISRPSAISPEVYALNNKKIICPKDSKAGGTWFAVDELQNVIILLNGGKEAHKVAKSYRKSRGLVVLELIDAENIIEYWQNMDLQDIEPFTLVALYDKKTYQLQWSGSEKSLDALDLSKFYIWSSSTLYSKEIRDKRKHWFQDFMANKKTISAQELINFHENTNPTDKENGLQINRNNIYKTLSITQVIVNKDASIITHKDLHSNKVYTINSEKFKQLQH
jgi:uncharacterized protein with NRDE domain